MKKHLVIAGLLLVLVIGTLLVFYTQSKEPEGVTEKTTEVGNGAINAVLPDATVITLTKDGFKPDSVTIKKGDTITFTSTIGTLYWPASNLHPSHLLYPEFDPEGPIQPDESWSYTFEKPGMWKFHDHLSPYFTGTVTVTE